MKFPAQNLVAMLILFVERIITKCIAGNKSDHTTRISNSNSNSNLDSGTSTSLGLMELQGTVSFYDTAIGARDFGGIYHHKPIALVNPASVQDIVKVVKMAASSPNLTVAARGNGHSINGQAQAPNGLVLNMSFIKGIKIFEGNYTRAPYVDAGAGELWMDVLKACLKVGLTPRSWTDYLFLSVGGTLSNGGVSGQTFKFGPQISNVLQLQIVSGNGEAMTCSPEQSEDLFYGALGGLGQFGIITKARIMLQKAPDMVRWIRIVYSDFEDFRADQEMLIGLPEGKSFDYVEGFVFLNNCDPVNGWPCVPLSPSSSFDPQLIPDTAGPVLYCLEVALHYDHHTDLMALNKRMEMMLGPLRFIRGLHYCLEISYLDFLNRVEEAEVAARSSGIWDAPHPWLNMFVPKSKISEFDRKVFRQILKHGVGGPMLVYPVNRNKWDCRMSAIVPDEDIFYLVALLRFSPPYPSGPPLQSIIAQNEEILHYCTSRGIDMKLYIPHYKNERDWKRHFGRHWHQFERRKNVYDPRAILAPGQRIFPRSN